MLEAPLRQIKAQKTWLIDQAVVFQSWCPRPDSNRYGFITRGILSPLRLPFRHSGTKLLVPRVRLELTTP